VEIYYTLVVVPVTGSGGGAKQDLNIAVKGESTVDQESMSAHWGRY